MSDNFKFLKNTHTHSSTHQVINYWIQLESGEQSERVVPAANVFHIQDLTRWLEVTPLPKMWTWNNEPSDQLNLLRVDAKTYKPVLQVKVNTDMSVTVRLKYNFSENGNSQFDRYCKSACDNNTTSRIVQRSWFLSILCDTSFMFLYFYSFRVLLLMADER